MLSTKSCFRESQCQGFLIKSCGKAGNYTKLEACLYEAFCAQVKMAELKKVLFFLFLFSKINSWKEQKCALKKWSKE